MLFCVMVCVLSDNLLLFKGCTVFWDHFFFYCVLLGRWTKLWLWWHILAASQLTFISSTAISAGSCGRVGSVVLWRIATTSPLRRTTREACFPLPGTDQRASRTFWKTETLVRVPQDLSTLTVGMPYPTQLLLRLHSFCQQASRRLHGNNPSAFLTVQMSCWSCPKWHGQHGDTCRDMRFLRWSCRSSMTSCLRLCSVLTTIMLTSERVSAHQGTTKPLTLRIAIEYFSVHSESYLSIV